MRLIANYLLTAVAICVLIQPASAAPYLRGDGYEFQVDRSAPTVFYINGIRTTPAKAATSSELLLTTLRSNGLPANTYNHNYFWNPADGSLDDRAEVMQQSRMSDQILALSGGNRDEYYKRLGLLLNQKLAGIATLSGAEKRVVQVSDKFKQRLVSILATSKGAVVVAHSQGNFYIEAAYSMLRAEGRLDLLSRIRVVGVAGVSATTPSDQYITSTEDRAIIAQYGQTHNTGVGGTNLANYRPLNAASVPCIATICGQAIAWGAIDPTAHGFPEVYLNSGIADQASGDPFPRVMYRSVNRFLQELGEIATPTFEDAFDSVSIDTSKWTFERLNGNLATIVQSDGLLTINVAGGSCGACGISDGVRLRPVVPALTGDFDAKLTLEELERTSLDGTRPLSNVQLLLTSPTSELGVYVVGDATSNAGVAGHQIIAYSRIGGTVSYLFRRDLTTARLYGMQLRIRRSTVGAFLGYRLAGEIAWTEATVPTSFPPSAQLIPSIVVSSGDGRGTNRNSIFKVRFDSFTLTR